MFKIILSNCCGLDVHKTLIYACVGITDSHNRTITMKPGLPPSPKVLETFVVGWRN